MTLSDLYAKVPPGRHAGIQIVDAGMRVVYDDGQAVYQAHIVDGVLIVPANTESRNKFRELEAG